MSDKIGKRGESIFSTIISRYINAAGFLFAPSFMGDKFPVVDFYVDLLNYPSKRGFFFASVKSTTLGYYPDNSKLKISINRDEIGELKKFPVPVYLFGIDEKAERGYFICGNTLDASLNLNGIPTKYPVDGVNIGQLWKEVADFWDNSNEITKFVSSFN